MDCSECVISPGTAMESLIWVLPKHALRALNVDEHGLDEMDNRILYDYRKIQRRACGAQYHFNRRR
jgi:Holliday junction resolvasome RuvABC ATP-dependent DNA helicase subunit